MKNAGKSMKKCSKCEFCRKIYEKCQNISKKHQFLQKITKNSHFSDQKYVFLLHWSCVIHQKLYCCYIGAVSFTKNCNVVTLELCHSPKKCIVVTHWSCDIHLKLYCCYVGSGVECKELYFSCIGSKIFYHQKLHCNCNQAKMSIANHCS